MSSRTRQPRRSRLAVSALVAVAATAAVLAPRTTRADDPPAAKAAEDYDKRSKTGAQDPAIDAKIFELSRKGMGHYYNNEFDAAITTFREIVELDPLLANGHVYLLGTYQAMMQDYRNRKFVKQFEDEMDQALDVSEERIDSKVGLARAYQYLGATYGFKGLYSAMNASWFTAFRDGQRAYDNLREALKLRPDIADADYGVGFFLYWRAVKASVFKWLLFWGDTKPDGIRRLLRARAEGELCGPLAEMALVKVHANDKAWDKLHEVGAAFQKRYPGNVGILWERGKAYVAQGNWEAARGMFVDVEARLKEKKYASREAFLEVRYFLGLCDLKLGKKDAAKAAFKEVVAAEDSVDSDLWQDQDYTKAAKERLDEMGL